MPFPILLAPGRSAASGRISPPSGSPAARPRRAVSGALLLATLLVASPACRNAPAGSSPPGGSGSAAATLPSSPPVPAGADDLFEDVTARSGIDFVHQLASGKLTNIVESVGSGGAILDFDRDGFADIYVVNAGPDPVVTVAPPGTKRLPNRLYRNRGDGTFEDVTAKAGVAGAGFGVMAAAADYDNDGDTDLFVVNVGRSLLYRNRGDGSFEDVTAEAGLAGEGTAAAATFLDADGDGWLDLFVVHYLTLDPAYKLHYSPDGYPPPLAYEAELNALYRNRGDGTFEDISEAAGVRIPNSRGMGVTPFDFDGDGRQDLFVTNDASPSNLLRNEGGGRFRDVGVETGAAFSQDGDAAASMGPAVGDVNGDGVPDVLVTSTGYGSLFVGSKDGLFEDRVMASGIGPVKAQYASWGGNFLDFDNDGDPDVLIVNGDLHYLNGWESLLFENDGTGTFTDASTKGGAFFAAKFRGRGSAILDFDNDGRLDILTTHIADRCVLLKNRDRSGNRWIALDLEGTTTNRDGFGAKVTVTAGGRSWTAEARCPTTYLFQGDRRLHFGLGSADVVDSIEILWPGGQRQRLTSVKAGQVLRVKEPGVRR